MALHIIDHPLVQHKLSIMRRKETSTTEFRTLLREIAMFMGYEVTRDFPIEYVNEDMKHDWGQRVVRIYDPDKHMIEIGEPMEVWKKEAEEK